MCNCCRREDPALLKAVMVAFPRTIKTLRRDAGSSLVESSRAPNFKFSSEWGILPISQSNFDASVHVKIPVLL